MSSSPAEPDPFTLEPVDGSWFFSLGRVTEAIGYPALITRDFQAQPGVPGVRSFDEGTEGFIKDANEAKSAFLFQTSDSALGWVPFTYVIVGRARKIDDPVAIKAAVPVPPKISEALYSGGGNMLSKTVTGLLSAFYHHADQLPAPPTWLEDRLSTSNKIDVISKTITGGIGRVSPQLAAHFQRGSFTWRQAFNSSRDARADRNQGVYLIAVEHDDGTLEIYVGHTSKPFSVRRSEYVSDITDEKEQRTVIKALRRSKRWTMFPICYINGLRVRDPVLILAEQVFVELIRSYSAKLLSYKVQSDFELEDEKQEEESDEEGSGEDSKSKGAGQDEEPQPDAESKDATKPKLTKVAASLQKKDTAVILMNLASEVFKKTGWTPLTELANFGPTVGLNGQPPLVEPSYDAVQWVRTEGPGFLNFRRTGHNCRLKVGVNGKERIIVFQKHVFIDKKKSLYLMEVPANEYWPAAGTRIHQVFELDTSDTIRDHSFSYLPRIGPFSDFSDALKIRFRIEWKDANGEWIVKYLEKTGTDERVKGAKDEGDTQRYSHATGLRNYLLQAMRKLPADGSLKWLTDFGLARVKRVYFDYLDWSIKAYDINDQHHVDPPTKLDAAQVGQQLIAAGAERWVDPDSKSEFRQYADGTDLEKGRHGCDLCHVQKAEGVTEGSYATCVQIKDTNRCKRCYRYGMPCTFTKTAALMANDTLRKAVSPGKPLEQNYQPATEDEMVDY